MLLFKENIIKPTTKTMKDEIKSAADLGKNEEKEETHSPQFSINDH